MPPRHIFSSSCNFRPPWHSPQVRSANGSDRQGLLALYHATRRPEWKNNGEWGTGTDISLWHGVTVNNESRVVRLDLMSNNLPVILSTHLSYDALDLPQECFDRKWPFHEFASLTGHTVVFLVLSRVLHTVYA